MFNYCSSVGIPYIFRFVILRDIVLTDVIIALFIAAEVAVKLYETSRVMPRLADLQCLRLERASLVECAHVY